MASSETIKIANKQRRQAYRLKQKKQKEAAKREARFRRKKQEDQNPELRATRRARNIPTTIESKRVWDEVDSGDEDDGRLGLSINVLEPKRRKIEKSEPQNTNAEEDADEVGRPATDSGEEAAEGATEGDAQAAEEDEHDSMLDTDSEPSDDEQDAQQAAEAEARERLPSEAPSAATDLTVRPDALKTRFPALFADSGREPKVLVTTSLNSTLHAEARMLTDLFPNSTYVRRSAHAHAHKYSVREIAGYASAAGRDYTHVVVLREERKRPAGLEVVALPAGPMFHFSVSSWVPGARIPGHGRATAHAPELVLNGFRTPLGLLTAHLFRALFPPAPQLAGRQVVTLHNQRDYVFVRRHRYVFRARRATEKQLQAADGRPVPGVEDVRAGLQELGPRFTLKLRRVDRGIQRASGQEWEWKAHDEKVRTRFSL